MNVLAKRIAAQLPNRWQQELKRRYFSYQLKNHRFHTDEKEYELLENLVQPSDWVLDIGANIGHYTAKFSRLVGPEGRVIAFEPVADTFELLAANVALLEDRNVTLVNAAASATAKLVGMDIPKFSTGLSNYYMAQVSEDAADTRVLCLPVDSLQLPHAIRLAKIDAEGHELEVLRGMRGVLERDHPTLIVEDNSAEATEFLQQLGYIFEQLKDSSNRIFRWR